MKMREFAAGEVVFRENEIGETAYVIAEGRVEVFRGVGGKEIHLAYLGPGEPFGEMGMIEEKPRSATVIAVERTRAHELHRDNFVQALQTHPELTISLLRVLFERLREADAAILEIYRSHPELSLSQPGRIRATGTAEASDTFVSLEGLTPKAIAALSGGSFEIKKFPFRIGRQTADPLAHNDLSISDEAPLQISRHHVSFIKRGHRVGITDRGSRLGSSLDGRQIGGDGQSDTIFLNNPESTLVLGSQDSPYIFKVRLKTVS
jgi:CRP-like cAMP-binding protein